jgi:Ceramidase
VPHCQRSRVEQQRNTGGETIADFASTLCYPVQMMLGSAKNGRRVRALLILMLASLVGLLLLPPIVQNQHYHDFADDRTIFGIPNFWNVVSNFPFIAIGVAGLWQLRRDPAIVVLFLGILLTGFGSAYYHLDPNDRTLFWDRLPMAIAFMAILSIAVEERVEAKAGANLLWPLITVGVFSLLLWRWTGDLRLYGWVQFFPCLAVPLLFVLFSPKYSGTSYWLIAAALYALAKLFEFYDNAIYSIGSLLSGHTLKHIVAAAACVAILRYFQKRQPIPTKVESRPSPYGGASV